MKTEDAVALISRTRMTNLDGWDKDFIYSMKGRLENGEEIKETQFKKIEEIYRKSHQPQKENSQIIGRTNVKNRQVFG